ncbi:unnamed protein product [Orchesella dallaii]|uniref:Uncharacterized protein n=1 Tax=Orchesella dallaii TaxID=48710 RepID=A0ABP1QPN5_9HEXA
MVAGVIASLIRGKSKKKQKRQKIDRDVLINTPHRSNVTILPFPKFAPKWLSTKEAAALQAKRAANESLKKIILGQEFQKLHRKQAQQAASQDAVSQVSYENEEFGSSGNAYTAIYIGLVLICIGVVITFVGLGEKGFKTIELKMIGPVLCVIGLTSITVKIIHCSFPQMFQLPSFLNRKAKLRDSDQSNLMEKGVQNGHFGKNSDGPKVLSPRVKLQSTKKTPRPTSTIPNYIGNDSSEDDDFDPGRSRPHSNRYNNAFEQSPKSSSPSSTPKTLPSSTTPVTVLPSAPSTQQPQQQPPTKLLQQQPPPQNELLLSPQGLIL